MGGVVCTFGIVVYPPWSLAPLGLPPPLPPFRFEIEGLGLSLNGHPGWFSAGLFSFTSRGLIVVIGEGGWSPLCVWTATGLNSRGRLGSIPPAFACSSDCFCCKRLACVGRSCCSGGNRGSGLYIVASHGASPSGRLMAVAGRVSRPERDLGRAAGDALELADVDRGLGGSETLRRAVEALRALPDWTGLLTVRCLLGDVDGALNCVTLAAGVGVLFGGSP